MSCRAAFWYGNVAGHLGHGLCCSPKLAHRKSPGKCEGAKLSSQLLSSLTPQEGKVCCVCRSLSWPCLVASVQEAQSPSGAVIALLASRRTGRILQWNSGMCLQQHRCSVDMHDLPGRT